MSWLQAILLAIVEGLTEFLPVSSTGHMAMLSAVFGTESDPFVKLYEIAIQFGAILSVLVVYFRRFINLRDIQFYLKLLAGFIPAAIAGKLIGDYIDELLETPVFISITLVVGGMIILILDKVARDGKLDTDSNISLAKAFIIGCFQVLAVVAPGTSRSASTIWGGMATGLSRRLAAEFSFFLAVPTLFAATAYKLLKYDGALGGTREISMLVAGNIIAFLVAYLTIRAFIGFVQKNGFTPFGWYRIATGAAMLAYLTYAGKMGF